MGVLCGLTSLTTRSVNKFVLTSSGAVETERSSLAKLRVEAGNGRTGQIAWLEGVFNRSEAHMAIVVITPDLYVCLFSHTGPYAGDMLRMSCLPILQLAPRYRCLHGLNILESHIHRNTALGQPDVMHRERALTAIAKERANLLRLIEPAVSATFKDAVRAEITRATVAGRSRAEIVQEMTAFIGGSESSEGSAARAATINDIRIRR
jgi:hypothetical protein